MSSRIDTKNWQWLTKKKKGNFTIKSKTLPPNRVRVRVYLRFTDGAKIRSRSIGVRLINLLYVTQRDDELCAQSWEQWFAEKKKSLKGSACERAIAPTLSTRQLQFTCVTQSVPERARLEIDSLLVSRVHFD